MVSAGSKEIVANMNNGSADFQQRVQRVSFSTFSYW